MIESHIRYASWDGPDDKKYPTYDSDLVFPQELPKPYDGWEIPRPDDIYDDFIEEMQVGDISIIPPYDPYKD